ncbi:porin [Massilia sp. PAMC28688]|uniref:porin n=1 Tax=Massilia sp. PAMC28688 TaxID=2861283 RepID=UPI001C63B6DD|nr:porin [Massilia sp. PAMC28688]QYF92118.1 porin [Massilia sp. PAMC28688]
MPSQGHPFLLRTIVAALLTCAASAQAEQGPSITISGFGTAAATMTDNADVEFARANQVRGASDQPRSYIDSNLGLQATATINERLSLTAQGMARQYGEPGFGADLTLAFAKLKVSDDFAVRVGRLGLPVYMVSDFRSVGYANTMLRPSGEVYGQVVNDTVDGVDVLYQHAFGDTAITAQLGFGHSNADLRDGAEFILRKSLVFNVLAERGPFTVRAAYSQTDVTLRGITPLDGLVATLREVGMAQVADDLDFTHVPGKFSSLGFTMDHNNVLIQAELAKREAKSRLLIESTTSWYTMLGYRMGKFTPYYYYGDTRQNGGRDYAGVPTDGPLAGLGFAVQSLVKAPQQSSHAVGLRWDFHKSAALKVQIDRITPRDGAGLLTPIKPDFHNTPVHVAAVGIDFVF